MIIKRPTLLVNESIAKRNILRIAKKAQQSEVELIPHFKTPQSINIGKWFKAAGVRSITVSSVSMARYFVQGGWNNITIAFPLNIQEIEDIANLANQTHLTLLLNEEKQLENLNEQVNDPVNILIEVDCGSNRSGVDPNDKEKIDNLVQKSVDSKHSFIGFYSHFGHTYKARSKEEIISTFKTSFEILVSLKEKYSDFKAQISLGDTPSASALDQYIGIKSIHAGNFVFYDLMQVQIGSCAEEDIAVALACPVVSKNPVRTEVVVYGGGIHLSKESMFDKEYDCLIYGKPVKLNSTGWSSSIPGCFVKSLSQEHGVIQLTPEAYRDIKIGDVIGILPVHSCMTADSMGSYLSVNGDLLDHM